MIKNYLELEQKIQRHWYTARCGFFSLCLWPLALVYRLIVSLRRLLYQRKILPSSKFHVPVIVVGNITLGGTGKTPLVIYLIELLQRHGWNPGVVSRGYGRDKQQGNFIGNEAKVKRSFKNGSIKITPDMSAAVAGDEPLLIAKRTTCPVVVAAKRARAAKHLLALGQAGRNLASLAEKDNGKENKEETTKVDVIICDDGLQHYALARDIEIVVVDAARGFGNGQCLPAGPLREPKSRLDEVDFVVVNGKEILRENAVNDEIAKGNKIKQADLKKIDAKVHTMHLQPGDLLNMASSIKDSPCSKPAVAKLAAFSRQKVHAVAGIGNPERFFKELEAAGLQLIKHVFPDHHWFEAGDLEFKDDLAIIMTEKDAVKCCAFAREKFWYLPVTANVSAEFEAKLLDKLSSLK